MNPMKSASCWTHRVATRRDRLKLVEETLNDIALLATAILI